MNVAPVPFTILFFSVAQVIYLFAPLLFAAALSAVVLRFDLFPGLRRPIDGGLLLGSHRLFGDSKTWRGVVVAVVGCVAATALQKHVIADAAGSLPLLDYAQLNVFVFGTALGGGAILGELPNSFVKRRLGIGPGKTTRGPLAVLFYVWDQVDLLTTSWPLLCVWFRPTLFQVATSVVVVMLLHPAVSLIGYVIGARKTAR